LSGIISLSGTAATAGMSRSAFSRYFKKIMGKNLSDFVNEMRIGQVCRDLIETNLTISEIAFEAGFENL